MTFEPNQVVALKTWWHGVPKGTRLVVCRAIKPGFYPENTYEVRREDGDELPGPFSTVRRAAMSGDDLEPAQ